MGNCFLTASQIIDPVKTQFEHVPVGIPDYDKFQISTIVTGKEGRAPGELYSPYGVAINEVTHQIFVASCFNHSIEIFSETGEFIFQLGLGHLTEPRGIAIYGDSVYVSCRNITISKFSLTDLRLVKQIGGWGSNNEQFHCPRQLTTDPIGRVFIADTYNDRICIYDTNLNHLRNIWIGFRLHPSDVKISRDRMYVLCPYNDPCMYVLTLEGDRLHSLITCGEEITVLEPQLFCLDPLNNFVISDNHSIRVLSPEGNLLHKIGRKGHQQGMFYKPRGVTITSNGRLVCVSRNDNYGLQIFC